MAKLNLSAMQNIAATTVNTSEETVSTKQDVLVPSIWVTKKKMSLNSLISWTSEDEIQGVKEDLSLAKLAASDVWFSQNQEEKIQIDSNQIAINPILEEKALIEEKSQILNQENINLVEVKEEKIEILEDKKPEELKEEVKTVNISDWDTIGNLITEINKTEMFVWYVSSFEKEMQALKNKNTKKSDKKEENKKVDIITETKVVPVIIEKEELDLDKIIEEAKIKEEVKILEEAKLQEKTVKIEQNSLKIEEKVNTPLENISKSINDTNKKKISLKIPLMIFSVFLILISWFFYYTNMEKSIETNTVKVNVLETNNTTKTQEQEAWKLTNPKIDTENTNINNTTNNEEVKEKLIKYFKNKQNSVKIDQNKN